MTRTATEETRTVDGVDYLYRWDNPADEEATLRSIGIRTQADIDFLRARTGTRSIAIHTSGQRMAVAIAQPPLREWPTAVPAGSYEIIFYVPNDIPEALKPLKPTVYHLGSIELYTVMLPDAPAFLMRIPTLNVKMLSIIGPNRWNISIDAEIGDWTYGRFTRATLEAGNYHENYEE